MRSKTFFIISMIFISLQIIINVSIFSRAIEIYQNCNVFNDGAFFGFTDKSARADNQLLVEHGQPLIFGKEVKKGVPKKDADEAKKKLEAAGAKVELK